MSKSQHTPGPWVTLQADPCAIYQKHDIIYPEHNVARVFTRSTEGEEQANARLIAAAPDLLLACLDIMDYCDEFPTHVPNWLERPVQVGGKLARLRKAVAKARGQ